MEQRGLYNSRNLYIQAHANERVVKGLMALTAKHLSRTRVNASQYSKVLLFNVSPDIEELSARVGHNLPQRTVQL